jgi:hypothetical protein
MSEAERIADAIIRDVGKTIVLGLPLGLGKACHLANALYARAAADRSIKLSIFTALTLEKPHYANDLERRFLEPVIERLFGGYPEMEYARALRHGTLPPNIEVNEFFFLAGQWLGVPRAQQSYISANYTHAYRYLIERGVNVVAQLVAKRDGRYSLSCNTDTTLDLLKARASGAAKFMLVGQVNSELPFMGGEGDLPASEFAYMLDDPSIEFPLFAPPSEPVGLTEYAIGLNAARLVPDGGTLQIGIGRDGDAIAQSLILRQKNNAAFREAVAALSPHDAMKSELGTFDIGLHGLSEMLVPSFLELIDAGVLKREVDGILLHGGFFVGPKSFYKRLREMPAAEHARIRMNAISFTNQLYGDETARSSRPCWRAFRQHHDDGDIAGCRRFRRACRWTRRQRRGRPVQFRGAGVCVARCALDPDAGCHARQTWARDVEHRVELRARNHSAPSARCVCHGIWRGRCARQKRCGGDRRDALHRGFAFPAGFARAREGRGKDRRRLMKFPLRSARTRRIASIVRWGLCASADCCRHSPSAPTSTKPSNA